MSRRVRILVVDDSPLVRRIVARVLGEDEGLEVVGTAGDGAEAIAEACRLRPDVVTLDISMPVMDGLACLRELVRRLRQRVVILSTLALESSFVTYKALASGAVDFVTKPGQGDDPRTLGDAARELRRKVWAAAAVPAYKVGRAAPAIASRPFAPTIRGGEARPGPSDAPPAALRLIGVGGSTGGVPALETLLRALPSGLPAAILAVQHMPPGFTTSFARYLDSIGTLRVQEGVEGEVIRPSRAYLAPSGAHMRVQPTPRGLVLRLDGSTPPENGYRPSINAMLCSVAAAERRRSVGILLSGMGDDGVIGLAAVQRVGGHTPAQDETSSVVYGMAERAVARGFVEDVLPPESLGRAVARTTLGAVA